MSSSAAQCKWACRVAVAAIGVWAWVLRCVPEEEGGGEGPVLYPARGWRLQRNARSGLESKRRAAFGCPAWTCCLWSLQQRQDVQSGAAQRDWQQSRQETNDLKQAGEEDKTSEESGRWQRTRQDRTRRGV